MLDKLNGMDEAISFTKEEESDNTLPFLYTLIIRENDRFLTTV